MLGSSRWGRGRDEMQVGRDHVSCTGKPCRGGHARRHIYVPTPSLTHSCCLWWLVSGSYIYRTFFSTCGLGTGKHIILNQQCSRQSSLQVPVQTARTPYARTGPFSVMFTPFPSCDLHTRRASTRRPLSTASVAPLLLLWPALPFSLFLACASSTPH